MTFHELTSLLGGWEGYVIAHAERREAEPALGRAVPEVHLTLAAEPGRPKVCDGCGQTVETAHDQEERLVRDLPLFDAVVWLKLPRFRLACPRCGPKLERLAWLARYARVTRRLGESAARLCQHVPIRRVAEFFGLAWSTVKAIDHAWLEEQLGPLDLTGVTAIGLDEFALQKGHRYATVFVEPATKRVLWLCRGRRREDIRPFFELLGEAGRAGLRVAVMDMSAAFEEEVRAQCPQAEIVFDLFHVAAKYGREVIDRVRVDEANRLRGDRRARKVVKGSRWLLLRNAANVPRADRVKLKELLAANRKLCTVYVLKDDLKHLWDYRSPGAALRFWRQWLHRAMRSRIEPLKRFARQLKERWHGIVAHCRWPLHTSLLEGINNTIKVIKRRAYGFRDDAYFFLKIRYAFPGNR